MNDIECPGRIHVKLDNFKWYKLKNVSAMIYTCCEICYNKYIKNTHDENKYEEYICDTVCSCDYQIYNEENISLSTTTKNMIRLSLIDIYGKRYQKNNTDDNYIEYIIPANIKNELNKCHIFIENLTNDPNLCLYLDDMFLNDMECFLGTSNNMGKTLIEFDLALYSTLSPDKNKIGDDNLEVIEMRFKVYKYRLDFTKSVNLYPLIRKNNAFVDISGNEIIKLPDEPDTQHKALVCINIFENNKNDYEEFILKIKFCDMVQNVTDDINLDIVI